MTGQGDEVSSPWGGDTSPVESTPSPPSQPIVLGGAEGVSVSTEMQSQMPVQTPQQASNQMLTGSVGTIDSGIWQVQAEAASKGSTIKGIGLTLLFGFAVFTLPMIILGFSENNWEDNWHSEEELDIAWDQSRSTGTFQLEYYPIEECNLYLNEGKEWWEEGRIEAWADCDGDLFAGGDVRVAGFVPNPSGDNATIFYYPTEQDSPLDGIELRLKIWNQTNRRHESISFDSTEIDANKSMLAFSVENITQWPSCEVFLDIKRNNRWDSQWLDMQWVGAAESTCPAGNFFEYIEYQIGNIDHETGLGVLELSDSLDEDVVLTASYSERYEDDFDSFEFLACFAPIVGVAAFAGWIGKVIQAFKAGLTNTGTGMLVGLILAIFIVPFVSLILGFLLFGF